MKDLSQKIILLLVLYKLVKILSCRTLPFALIRNKNKQTIKQKVMKKNV